MIDFTTASILSRMIAGEQDKFDAMYEYDWLWTIDEIREIRRERLKSAVKIKGET